VVFLSVCDIFVEKLSSKNICLVLENKSKRLKLNYLCGIIFRVFKREFSSLASVFLQSKIVKKNFSDGFFCLSYS
jgi:hypothetical protein